MKKNFSVPTAATSAIYGDSNVQTATFIPDLGEIRNDPYVSVQADSGKLGIFQRLDILDNVYDTKTEIQYTTNTTATQNIFQFSLMGWTKLRQMALEIPVQFTISSTANNGLTPGCLAQNTIALKQNNMSKIINMSQPNYPVLTFLKRMEVYVGNNNTPLGKSQQWSTVGLKSCAFDTPYDDNLMDYAGMLGLPVSQIVSLMQTTTSDNVASYGADLIPKRIKDAWIRLFQSAVVGQNPSEPSDVQTFIVRIPIPFALLNYFFKSDAFLPPSLKFKIDCTFDNNDNIIGVLCDSTSSTSSPSMVVRMKYLKDNWRITYFNHQLRQPLQSQIMQRWISSPFLYNYETSEYYEQVGDDVTNNFTLNIAISQQRPTQLFIGFYSNTPSIKFWNFPASNADNAGNFWGISSNTTKIPPNATTVQGAWGSMNWPDSLINHPGIQYMTVAIAGRPNYYYDNAKQTYGTNETGSLYYNSSVLTAQDYIFSDAAQQNYPSYGAQGATERILAQFQWGVIGSYGILTLAPGNDVDRGAIPSDQGAHNVRVEITLLKALSKDAKLLIYKKMPEQVILDSSQNATLVQWPAVKSNTGYLIPNATTVAQ